MDRNIVIFIESLCKRIILHNENFKVKNIRIYTFLYHFMAVMLNIKAIFAFYIHLFCMIAKISLILQIVTKVLLNI